MQENKYYIPKCRSLKMPTTPAKNPPVPMWSDDIEKNRQCAVPTTWRGCCHPHDLLLPEWFVPVYMYRFCCRWGDRAECPRSFSSVPALHRANKLLPCVANSFHWQLSTAPLHLPDYIFKTTSHVSDLNGQRWQRTDAQIWKDIQNTLKRL